MSVASISIDLGSFKISNNLTSNELVMNVMKEIGSGLKAMLPSRLLDHSLSSWRSPNDR